MLALEEFSELSCLGRRSRQKIDSGYLVNLDNIDIKTVCPLIALTLVFSILSIGGCVGDSSARRGGIKAAHQERALDTKNRVEYSLSGRAVRGEDGSATIVWSGSTATICFRGADASVDLTDSGQNQFAVLIDEKLRREKLIPEGGREKLELVRGLERGEHTIQLVRLTEASFGQTQIHGFILDQYAEALPPPKSSVSKIVIYGDSISAGYGVEGIDEKCGFSPETENYLLTYGAIAARAAGAEVTNISWSGKGVFTNRGSQTDTVPLPELFNLALPRDPSSKIENEEADLVLINLGTNDFAPEVKDVTPFTESYKTFVSKVRAMHLNAEILLTVGPLLSDEWPEGKQALSKVRKTLMAEMEVRKASGDEKVHVLEFRRVQPNEGWGCDFHPSKKTHHRMARELLGKIQSEKLLPLPQSK